ncbi:MAG: nucleotidyl transferase, partial [Thermofilum sp. ex4484_82]
MLARRGKVYVYRALKENWFDVGRPWDLLDANAYLLSRLGQKLSRKISNKRIIIRSPVYLGKNIEIGEGSIIGPNVAIYDNVKIG